MNREKAVFSAAAGKILCFFAAACWVLLTVFSAGTSGNAAVIKEEIPNDIEVIKSEFIKKGWKIWLEEGQSGYKNVVRKSRYLFGSEVQAGEVYRSEPLKKPKKALVIKGDSDEDHPITVPEETYVHYRFNMEATAYDPGPESNSLRWAGITSLGWRTRFGIAAVDPKVIALRSLLYIEGYGFAWAGDVGGAIKGRKIDLCYNTTAEALEWGRRNTKVYVLGRRPLSYYQERRAAQK